MFAKNKAVTDAETPLDVSRKSRQLLAFQLKQTNPDCVQCRVQQILSYVGGELGKTSAAYKQIYRMYKKIKPTYPKKANPPLPRGAGKSPMERSFSSLAGIGDDVVSIITSLGASYAPTNSLITIPNFTTAVSNLKALNAGIALLLKDYATAVIARKAIYDGTDGLNERIPLIKSYLAGFPGAKNNAMYVSYDQALKGI